MNKRKMESQKISYRDNILLKRLTKGKYAWEIRVSSDNLKEAIEDLEEINKQMINKFIEGVKKR